MQDAICLSGKILRNTFRTKIFIALGCIGSISILFIFYVYAGNNETSFPRRSPIFFFPILQDHANEEKNRDKVERFGAATKYSTCSEDATAYGPGQKVISYSLYVYEQTNVSLYLAGVKPNLQSIPLVYPGWLVRIYTDEVDRIRKESPEYFTDYKFLFWCDVTNIPVLGDMRSMVAMTWRFLPIGDPLVDTFLSRDLDSRVTWRERKAVEEWEYTPYAFHSMRDHPYHGVPYLGAAWGARNSIMGGEESRQWQSEMIEASVKIGGRARNHDQNIISDMYYRKKLSIKTMAHDSYTCKQFPDILTIGFPSQRESPQDFIANVIGDPRQVYEAKECPEVCRRHKEWTNC